MRAFETAREATAKRLETEEGFRGDRYICPTGHPTIGFGTMLPLTEDEGRMLLLHRLNQVIKETTFRLRFVEDLPLHPKQAIYDMAYQMGVPTLLEFRKMLAALEAGDFATAARECLDSRYARQTPERANRNADMIRSCV